MTHTLAIIIPTRNRLELAQHAMFSVLTQSNPRIRVIVSDNSTDAGTSQQLQETCRQHQVTYIRPEHPCSMTEHWNWILDHVATGVWGDHLTILTDRMFYRTGVLVEIMERIDTHPRDVIAYPLDTIRDDETPIRLQLHPWTGRTTRIFSSQMATLLSRAEMPLSAPLLLNSIVPVNVLNSMRKVYPKICDTIAPDYGFCLKFLDLHESYIFYDKPILVQHGLSRSNGRSFTTGRATAERDDFLRNLPNNQKLNACAPIPEIPVAVNTAVHEYVAMLKRGPHRAFPPLDLEAYYRNVAKQVAALENPEDRASFLSLLPTDNRHDTTEVLPAKAKLRRTLRRWLWPWMGKIFNVAWHALASNVWQPPGMAWLSFRDPASARLTAARFLRNRSSTSFFLSQLEVHSGSAS